MKVWTQGDSSKGKCKVAWSMVCRPKDCGGLGFRRLAVWNRALLAKNLWAIISNRSCLWVDWVRLYALRDSQFWTAKRTTWWSWLLSKLMTLRPDIRRFVKVSIGDGSTTNAWEDAWLDCGHLADFVSYRFIHASGFSQTTTVRQLLDTFHDGWPDTWNTRFPVLTNLTLPSIRPNELDTVRWESDGQGDGVFSIQRAYTSFMGALPVVPWWRSVWFKCHIPKHAFCLWTACLNRLPTQDRMATWKEEPPDLKCSLCGITNDSHDHLFFECTFSRQVWLQIMENVHWVGFPCSWHAIVDALSNPTMAPLTVECKLALAASVYNIWCERNRRLFGGQQRPIPQVVQTIMANILDRIAWKRKKLMNSNHVDAM
ncbi:hypothetical protein OSB04_un000123 [Centaurea solstitialis]|uniref:Reverse transcriptase zinc-binding domain-containing protein n=1 Tax=Centaurea solstitialis TaxID=347529 RepID=A0AA38SR48_9ASTR|nr:hypothetical protein OSB04_un000123 [Centaurea solstitialis]